MIEHSTVPFTIIKETNGATADDQHSQYKWKAVQYQQEKMDYSIENITLLQEPTETLNMSVTLSKFKYMYDSTYQLCCSNCGTTGLCDGYLISCINYNRHGLAHGCRTSSQFKVHTNFDPKKINIIYDLRINFSNYLHEFSSIYSYEVVCKIPHLEKPDEYLFSCIESRSGKSIVFQKRYASTAFDVEFDFLANSNLYFGIRWLVNKKTEMSFPPMLKVIEFMNEKSDFDTVVLQAKDGQITAHQFVLSRHSDVFRAMFAHQMKEKQNGIIKISDFETKVLKKMVGYLYTGELGNIAGMTQDLFKLAHRYQLDKLCRRCEEYYLFNVTINKDYIVEMLELIDLYELEELKRNTENFVKRYESDVSKLPSYQKYLCQSMNIDKAVNALILADTYGIADVKTSALEFIKLNFNKMAKSKDFLKLFQSNPRLMQEIYVHSF